MKLQLFKKEKKEMKIKNKIKILMLIVALGGCFNKKEAQIIIAKEKEKFN